MQHALCCLSGNAVHRRKDAVYPSFSGKIDACGMMQSVQGKQHSRETKTEREIIITASGQFKISEGYQDNECER